MQQDNCSIILYPVSKKKLRHIHSTQIGMNLHMASARKNAKRVISSAKEKKQKECATTTTTTTV